jgi:hypothetical protein
MNFVGKGLLWRLKHTCKYNIKMVKEIRFGLDQTGPG